METPQSFEPRLVGPDTFIFPSYTPVPGMGVLAVNAYLIRGHQPVLIDTGLGALTPSFLRQLESTLDLDDLRWIYLTHTDPDHVGALGALLSRAPQAKVITTYLGMGKLGMFQPVDPGRVHLLNPGQGLEIGDRVLTALRPPTFDAPETTALYDSRSGALFSSDCFGGVLGEPRERVAEIRPADLRSGMITWTTVDCPWIHRVAPDAFQRSLRDIQRLDPSFICSSHLPPVVGMTDTLLQNLGDAQQALPFVGPDQEALQRMLAQVA